MGVDADGLRGRWIRDRKGPSRSRSSRRDPGRRSSLDVGEREAFKRGHWPGAVNIPADELQIRGGPELPRDGTIVIDCTQEQNFRCAAASSLLLEQGFPSVIVMVR